MRRVLVLRPEPGATVERAARRGLDAIALPLFEIVSLAWQVPDPSAFDALLLTSANAVRHGGDGLAQLLQLPVHAVGDATAEAAESAGLAVASTGEAGVDALLAALDPHLRLLHLCGEHRRAPAHALQAITAVAVYRSREAPAPDPRAFEGCVALIHSPRAGRRFATLVDDGGVGRSSIAIAAISPAAAESVGEGWAAREAAETPRDNELLALAERLCNTPYRT